MLRVKSCVATLLWVSMRRGWEARSGALNLPSPLATAVPLLSPCFLCKVHLKNRVGADKSRRWWLLGRLWPRCCVVLGLGCYAGPASVRSPLHAAWFPFSVVPSPSDLHTMEMAQAGGPLCCPWKLIWITMRLCRLFYWLFLIWVMSFYSLKVDFYPVFHIFLTKRNICNKAGSRKVCLAWTQSCVICFRSSILSLLFGSHSFVLSAGLTRALPMHQALCQVLGKCTMQWKQACWFFLLTWVCNPYTPPPNLRPFV